MMVNEPKVQDLMATGEIASLMHLSYRSETDDFVEEFSNSTHTYTYYVEDFEKEVFQDHYVCNQLKMLIRKVFITLTPEGDSDDVLGTIPPSVDSQNYVAFQKALDTLYVSISGGDRIKVFDLIALKSGRFAARLTKEFFETIRPAFRAGKTHCVLAYDLDFDLSVPNLISIYSYLEKRKFENGKKANSDKFTLIKLRKVCPDLRNADILTITDEMLAESLIRALDYLQTIGISYTVAWRAHMKKGDKVASISMENFNKINIIFTWNFKTETKFSNRPKNVVSDRNSIEIKMKGNQNVQ